MGKCGICGKSIEATAKYCPTGCNPRLSVSEREWGKYFHYGKKKNSVKARCGYGCLSKDDIECSALKLDVPMELISGVDRCECRRCHEEN